MIIFEAIIAEVITLFPYLDLSFLDTVFAFATFDFFLFSRTFKGEDILRWEIK